MFIGAEFSVTPLCGKFNYPVIRSLHVLHSVMKLKNYISVQ